MKRWAVTLLCGRSRSSYARPSVRLLTAALDALYAAFPLGVSMMKINCRCGSRTEGRGNVRGIGDTLLGSRVDDHRLVLLVEHGLV